MSDFQPRLRDNEKHFTVTQGKRGPSGVCLLGGIENAKHGGACAGHCGSKRARVKQNGFDCGNVGRLRGQGGFKHIIKPAADALKAVLAQRCEDTRRVRVVFDGAQIDF